MTGTLWKRWKAFAGLEEHSFRNYGAALEYAEHALAGLDSRHSLRGRRWNVQKRALEQRIERLREKLQ